MTTFAWVWLAVFALLAGLSLRRPVWAVCLYLQTYFAQPGTSWWGESLPSFRWNLIAGLVLALAVAIDLLRRDAKGLHDLFGLLRRGSEHLLLRWGLLLLGAMVVNALAVNWFLAPDRTTSLPSAVYLAKHALLAWLVFVAVRRSRDSEIVVASLASGVSYLGLAVVVFDQGAMINGRLERFGPPWAAESNSLPVLVLVLLPLCGVMLFRGRIFERLLGCGALALGLWIVVLCKSRGAALAGFGTGVAMLVMMPRDLRKAGIGFCVGAVAVAALMATALPRAQAYARSSEDPQPRTDTVIDRFIEIPHELAVLTSSSHSRLLVWQAGLRVLREYPWGSGGKSFLNVRGSEHLVSLGIHEDRSVHNGYLKEAIDWGIQGLVLRLAFLGVLFLLLRKIAFAEVSGEGLYARAEACGLAAGLMVLLAASVFTTLLDVEWQYWIAGLALSGEGRNAGRGPGD